MHFTPCIFTLLTSGTALAALNEPCVGKGGAAGVCVKTSTCSSEGGTSIKGACPSDPSDIRCCTKPTCNSNGNCRWQSDCSGGSVSNQCPGPSPFKCCKTSTKGFGGYKTPTSPTVGTSSSACKAISVNGAKNVVLKFPGRVREIGCTRGCACSADPESDHCCGKAIDLMCSDAGGAPTMSGREIAEWVMDECESLKCKYVIWGQRIWNSGTKKVDWTSWKAMEDRKSVTKNHWDHVHVSFQ